MGMEPLTNVRAYQAAPSAQVKAVEEAPAARMEAAAPDTAELPKNESADLSNRAEGAMTVSPKEDQDSANQRIRKAVDEVNKKMANSEVQFGIHESTNRVVIKIIDRQSKEVLKELPPEKTLDMIAKAWELAGLLVDEKR